MSETPAAPAILQAPFDAILRSELALGNEVSASSARRLVKLKARILNENKISHNFRTGT